MSSFKTSRRNICIAFIENGKHISTAEKYIQENFTLSESQLQCVTVKLQKRLLPDFKTRWNKAGRNKDVFLKNNEQWLDGEFFVQFEDSEESSTSLPKSLRGRPCKKFEESAEITQKRKAIKLFRDSGVDHIYQSYVQGLRSIGEPLESQIIQELRSASPERKELVVATLRRKPVEPFTKREALAIYIDLHLTKNQYLHLTTCLKDKECTLLPSYKTVREAKEECYPDQIEITEVSATVKLQSLLDHTSKRILMIDSLNIVNSSQLLLYSKWGCDGSSGQSEYKQILSGESALISDSNLFISSLVPIKLVDEISQSVIWQNPTPSSVRYCRPILIKFTKETPEITRAIVDDIEAQICTLTPYSEIKNGKQIFIKHKLFFTMIDGKVTQVLTNTPSSSTCNVCLAKPTEMNNLQRVLQKPENEDSYRFGLSTLHAWIRFMELVLHISYNLSFKKWSATTEVMKSEKKSKKIYVQDRFRSELGLIIDKPRQGSGNSNDGNTARRFFANPACTARITGVDEELIKRFHVLLQTMSCGMHINAQKFGEYAFKTAELFVNKYNWYYMPSSVHKILIHGENIIRYNAVLPLGQLSEDAQESRNKDYKLFRLHHSRKCSRLATNEDVFHTLLYTSDPYITSLKKSSKRILVELDEEALQLVE